MNSEDSKAIYFISVASTLSGIHQQTIRTYEQKGLIKPFRTGGGTRRYSQEDIDKLIQEYNESAKYYSGILRKFFQNKEMELIDIEDDSNESTGYNEALDQGKERSQLNTAL